MSATATPHRTIGDRALGDRTLGYRAVVTVLGATVDAFYRRVVLEGGSIPATGPVLLVANHGNGLVDPLVISRLTPRVVRALAKAPLFKMPVLGAVVRGAGALPVYRAKDGADTAQNAATFAATNAALVDGSCVLIFPEGISHDAPQLQPLRTGAARMALEARAAGAADLQIIPVGLFFRDKERFRSAVAVRIGAPVPFGDLGVDDARALTARIDEALRATSVNLEAWGDLPLLEAVDAVWRIDDPNRSERLHRLAQGVVALRTHAPAELAAVRAQVAEWTARLDDLGLVPSDLAPTRDRVRTKRRAVLSFAARQLALFALGLPAALAGAVFFAPPFYLTHAVFLAMRPARDVGATVKVFASVVFFPLWSLAVTAGLAWKGHVALAICALAVLPVCGLLTRWFFRSRGRALRDIATFARLAFSRRLNAQLTAERDALVEAVEALAARVPQTS